MNTMKTVCILTAAVLLTAAGGTCGKLHTAAADSVRAAAAEEGTKIEQDNLIFKVYSDHAVVTGSRQTESAVIPSEINGVPVTEISSGFGHNLSLKTVTIGNGVKVIGNYAFEYCTNLETVNLPDSVETIGSDAFSYCTNLKALKLPAGVTSIGERAFLQCNIQSITIPEGVTIISYATFNGCGSLETVTLPSTVSLIDKDAFKGCEMLKDITIPRSVKEIGYRAFDKCSSLTSLTIPAGTERVDDYAFEACSELTLKVAAGSAAEWHAKEYKVKYEIIDAEKTGSFPTGDLTGDCAVSADDAQLALQAYTNTVAGKASGLSNMQSKSADVNADSIFSVEDVQYILRYYTEKNVAGKIISWLDLFADTPVTTTAPAVTTTGKATTFGVTTTTTAKVTAPAQTTAPVSTLPPVMTNVLPETTTYMIMTSAAPGEHGCVTTTINPTTTMAPGANGCSTTAPAKAV